MSRKCEVTKEQFAVMCFTNAAWKFLTYTSWAVGTILILFMMGIVVNITLMYFTIWCVSFISALYFLDMIIPGHNLIFTSDFWKWAEEVSNAFIELDNVKKKVEASGGEIEIQNGKITRYGRKLEAINTEEIKNDFSNLVDSIESFEKIYGRERTVKALADVLAAYVEIMGSAETTVDGQTYKIEVITKKDEEDEDEDE